MLSKVNFFIGSLFSICRIPKTQREFVVLNERLAALIGRIFNVRAFKRDQ